jgi:hypothetical protein
MGLSYSEAVSLGAMQSLIQNKPAALALSLPKTTEADDDGTLHFRPFARDRSLPDVLPSRRDSELCGTHRIADLSFCGAFANYLEQERAQVARDVEVLGEYTPFRKGETLEAEQARHRRTALPYREWEKAAVSGVTAPA